MKDSADLLKLIVNYSGPRYQLIEKVQKYFLEIRRKPDYANLSTSDLLRLAVQEIIRKEEENAEKASARKSE